MTRQHDRYSKAAQYRTRRFGCAVALLCALGLTAGGCGSKKHDKNDPGTQTLAGSFSLHADVGDLPDVAGVAYTITSADGDKHERVVPIRVGNPGATLSAMSNRRYADWLVALPAGPYRVRAIQRVLATYPGPM